MMRYGSSPQTQSQGPMMPMRPMMGQMGAQRADPMDPPPTGLGMVQAMDPRRARMMAMLAALRGQ